METPFVESKNIKPVKLPNGPVLNFEEVRVSGFGGYNMNSNFNFNLQAYTSIVLDYKTCRNIFAGTIEPAYICDAKKRGHGTCFVSLINF